MLQLRTVYEFGKLSEALRYFLPLGIFLAFGAICWVIYYYNNRYADDDERYNIEGFNGRARAMRVCLLGMACAAILFPFIARTLYVGYFGLAKRYKKHDYKLIQGRVRSLRDTVLRGGDIQERFKIDTIEFAVGQQSLCYNQTRSNGGTLRNDLYVKIAYYKTADNINCILKLETE